MCAPVSRYRCGSASRPIARAHVSRCCGSTARRRLGHRRDDDRCVDPKRAAQRGDEIEELEQRRLPRAREHDDAAARSRRRADRSRPDLPPARARRRLRRCRSMRCRASAARKHPPPPVRCCRSRSPRAPHQRAASGCDASGNAEAGRASSGSRRRGLDRGRCHPVEQRGHARIFEQQRARRGAQPHDAQRPEYARRGNRP